MSSAICVFYFSGTGNTKWVCEEFCRQYERIDNATLFNIDRYYDKTEQILECFKKADIIGFAYPIYGANIPRIFKDFLVNITNLNISNKKCFIITTVGYINAYGPYFIRNEIRKIGLSLCWHEAITYFDSTKCRNNVSIDIEKIRLKTSEKIEKMIRNIVNNKKHYGGIGPWIVVGYLVRKTVSGKLNQHYLKYKVDFNKCILCMKCVNDCPVEAITYSNDRFIFSKKCTVCFRCINKCPNDAINDN